MKRNKIKTARNRAEKEGDIVKAILDYLAYKKITAWRNQSGARFGYHTDKDGNRKQWAIRMSKKGVSDIIGIMPDGSGRILCLEVKTPKGKLTEEQALFLGEVVEKGGVAEVVRSIEDVQLLLQQALQEL